MTNNNYTQMTNQELLNTILQFNIKFANLERYIRNHYPTLFKEITNRTCFLNDYFNQHNQQIPLRARTYCLEHNISSHPLCDNPNCPSIDKRVGWDKGHKKFRTHCCNKCAQEDPVIVDRKKSTNNEHWGVDWTGQSKIVRDKAVITCRTTYGCDYAFQSDIVKTKILNSMHKKYGVDNYNQSEISHKYRRKRILHDEIWFDSSLEIKLYDFLKSNDIQFEYSPKKSIPYEHDGGTFYYHPDFLINGKIYEVKGDQFFKVDESGHEVMFNPYRNKNWSDERYARECMKYEAKHQCMLKNNVIILRKKDIDNLSIDSFVKKDQTY